jgi:hypothetical protein
MRHHNLQVTGSVVVNGLGLATTADLNTYTASTDANLSTLQTFTSSTSARLNSIEVISASNISRISEIEIVTSSTSARLNSIEIITASNVARINSLEITSASVNDINAFQNTKLNYLEEKTGSLATTGSNTFYGTQTFSGSVYIKENLIVQGSSSLQNITASAVDIGTNKIILNVDNPSVRYAGISVYDSGSTAGTGSLWWDSVENHWLYEHPSDSAAPYNSAILISGPKNAGNLGEELELVNNFIVKAVGGDHISSSAIYDDGTTIGLKSNTEVTGSFKIKGSQVIDGTNTGTSYIDGTIQIVGPSPIAFVTSANLNPSLNRWGIKLRGTSDGDFSLYDYTNSADRLSIDGTGKIGMGTTAPQTELHILGKSGWAELRLAGSTAGSGGSVEFFSGSTQLADIYGGSSKDLTFRINGTTTAMYINNGGRVGIGTTNPKTRVQIGSNLFFDDEGSTYLGQISFNRAISDGTISNSSYHAYQIQNYLGKLNMQIYKGSGLSETTHQFSGSAFGINREDPVYALDVATNSTNTFRAFRIQSVDDALITIGSTVASSQNWTFGASSNTSGQGANLFFIGTSNNTASSISQKVVIKSDGKVGIGTVPTYNLDVIGEFGVYGAGGASAGGVSIAKDSAGTGGKVSSYGGNSYLVFTTNSGGTNYDRLKITSAGVVHPMGNGTQDLGTSSLRWATIYTSDLDLSNGIGDYTIVEGEDDLFLYNNKKEKVYKFALIEVDPALATPKKS